MFGDIGTFSSMPKSQSLAVVAPYLGPAALWLAIIAREDGCFLGIGAHTGEERWKAKVELWKADLQGRTDNNTQVSDFW